jgi:hypothetical protein
MALFTRNFPSRDMPTMGEKDMLGDLVNPFPLNFSIGVYSLYNLGFFGTVSLGLAVAGFTNLDGRQGRPNIFLYTLVAVGTIQSCLRVMDFMIVRNRLDNILLFFPTTTDKKDRQNNEK